jgi:uncharacterized phage protein (TIGR02216 family)
MSEYALNRTPWRAWLAAAAGLGVAPAAFWRLSLKEWRALTQQFSAPTLDRAAFERLAARFPDQSHGR